MNDNNNIIDLNNMVMFDEPVILELLQLSKECIDKNILITETGIQEKNLKTIYIGVHSLKGLASIGIKSIVEESQIILNILNLNILDEEKLLKIKAHYPILKHHCNNYLKWYEKYKK